MSCNLQYNDNKIYSPETCCFVPNEINTGITNTKNKIGVKGVHRYDKNRYKAVLNGNIVGITYTIEEAAKMYKKAKEEHIKNLAEKWKPQLSPQTYQSLINYQVEIKN